MASLKAEKSVGTQLFGQVKKDTAKTSADGASKAPAPSKPAAKKAGTKSEPKKKAKAGKSAPKH
ncbi:unnamed protein product [Coffea canephora]|uniref:Uncharacterized protein n=1 Tax=Coffea canephora TaxID=49390 RepID=A0A068TW68_COFCA|nr:unnamed protein product [Coffea canephora]